MRPPIDRLRVHYFLVQLGITFRHPARLYLVGGTTLVYEGLREQSLDNAHLAPPPDKFTACTIHFCPIT